MASAKLEPAGTVTRLYALNGGLAVAPDRDVYTPGESSARPITLSCNAYLMCRSGEWILWDTGIDDDIARQPGAPSSRTACAGSWSARSLTSSPISASRRRTWATSSCHTRISTTSATVPHAPAFFD